MDNYLKFNVFNKEYINYTIKGFVKNFFHNWLCPKEFNCWRDKPEEIHTGHLRPEFLYLPNTPQEENHYNNMFSDLVFEEEDSVINSSNFLLKNTDSKRNIRGNPQFNIIIDDDMYFPSNLQIPSNLQMKSRSIGWSTESVKKNNLT